MGRVDVKEMLSEITPREFTAWMASDILDNTIGSDATQHVIAKVGAAIVNSWGGKTSPEMFLPSYNPEQKQEAKAVTPEQGAAMFSAWIGSRI